MRSKRSSPVSVGMNEDVSLSFPFFDTATTYIEKTTYIVERSCLRKSSYYILPRSIIFTFIRNLRETYENEATRTYISDNVSLFSFSETMFDFVTFAIVHSFLIQYDVKLRNKINENEKDKKNERKEEKKRNPMNYKIRRERSTQ